MSAALTVALSKGKLLSGTEALFKRVGLPFPAAEGRKLVVDVEGLRFLFVKDMDVPTYVEYGVADCGIAGRDVLLETASDVYEPLDLGFEVGSGGRYDSLLARFGRPLPAVGFMFGLDRLALLVDREALGAPEPAVEDVPSADVAGGLTRARALRAWGQRVRLSGGRA